MSGSSIERRRLREEVIIDRIRSCPLEELDDIETLFRSQDNLKQLKKWHEESKKKPEWKPPSSNEGP